ncbi:MAG: hypothetical protein IJF15_06425 [Oscillospiraceae bacterium]|nr:hypothetical protein [Oscillospiraceae bacterium]
MKIQYLGTAAAEGIPAIFCDCETCRKSALAGGRNIRTRSQALIDDCLLVDFPADTYMHFLQYGVPMTKIKSCLLTHSHLDHLHTDDLAMRRDGFAHIRESFPLTFYSDVSGYELIRAAKERYNIADDTVAAELLALNEPFEVEGYKVVALRAAHDPKSTPVVFLIEKDGKTLFYSNDTSEYPEESMEYLKTLKKPLDLISLDCTEACNHATYIGHLSLERCIALRQTLLDIGAADKNTKFILNHFSHNGENVLYDDFVKIAAEYGFDVTYDGMVVEF